MTHRPSKAMLDTSMWLAVFNEEPEADLLPIVQGDLRAVCTPIVLAEIAARHGLGEVRRGDPVADVEKASRYEDMTRDDAVAAARTCCRIRSQGHSKISLADTLIYATARWIGALLITKDGGLAGQEGVAVLAAAKARRP